MIFIIKFELIKNLKNQNQNQTTLNLKSTLLSQSYLFCFNQFSHVYEAVTLM